MTRAAGSEKTWLYAIALNCLRDHARRQSAEKRALERIGGPVEGRQPVDADAVHDRDLVRRSLETLSEDERLAVSLRFGADLTMPEIAKVIREPLTTVEGRVYRALGRLRLNLHLGRPISPATRSRDRAGSATSGRGGAQPTCSTSQVMPKAKWMSVCRRCRRPDANEAEP